jgi:hypothetical protein
MGAFHARRAVIRLGAIVALTAAGGCATENHFNSVYSVVPAYYLETKEDTYQIYDRPDLQRLAIAPSRGTALGAHIVDNLPLNLANFNGSRSPGSAYFHPLRQYFLQTGRRCELKNGYILMTPQWEFAYQCHPDYLEPYK